MGTHQPDRRSADIGLAIVVASGLAALLLASVWRPWGRGATLVYGLDLACLIVWSVRARVAPPRRTLEALALLSAALALSHWQGGRLVGVLLGAPDHADVIWRATAYGWLDEDADGAWDPGEELLAGVRFRAESRSHHTSAHPLMNETSGQDELVAMVALRWGDPPLTFDVWAEPPPGYRPTTAPRIRVEESPPPLLFGFARAPQGSSGAGQPTPVATQPSGRR